jgi:hypothetical protein
MVKNMDERVGPSYAFGPGSGRWCPKCTAKGRGHGDLRIIRQGGVECRVCGSYIFDTHQYLAELMTDSLVEIQAELRRIRYAIECNMAGLTDYPEHDEQNEPIPRSNEPCSKTKT